MDQSTQYGQMDFNLPHDMVKLPSGGHTYRPKKESLKVGYLTAMDENILMSQNTPKDGLIMTLLKNKIYEPGFDVGQLLEVDVQAILIFLRNTAFGPEYDYVITDPKTDTKFEAKLIVDEVNYIKPKHEMGSDSLFSVELPKSKNKVKCKLLSIKESNEIESLSNNYPIGMVAPIVTKKLESQIVELNGSRDKGEIAKMISNMPIADSKFLRRFLSECEPQLDLIKTVTAPSGEKVNVIVGFGVEFFRPFFTI